MAVVTTKSAGITNRDATPAVLSNSSVVKAALQKAAGVVAIANGDSIGSKFIVCSIPSNAVISSCVISAPDIGTTTAADVGLYQTTANGSAVVDADFFKAAVSLNGGAITKSEIVNGNIVTVANMEKRLYEHLSLTSDPGITYDVVLTLTGAADAAGSAVVEVFYGF